MCVLFETKLNPENRYCKLSSRWQTKTHRLDSDLQVFVNYLVNNSKIKARLGSGCMSLFTGEFKVPLSTKFPQLIFSKTSCSLMIEAKARKSDNKVGNLASVTLYREGKLLIFIFVYIST